eukprot:GHVS01080819.1.p1 GENE.GHVS01080819.1~~GHVS01080819.1.p1  ORF type:complete len:810 (+),score=159.92 GHVS01080819.1:221-2650(+)
MKNDEEEDERDESEEDDDDDEDDEEEDDTSSSSDEDNNELKRKRGAGGGTAKSGVVGTARKKRKRKIGGAAFLDTEAQVGEEDEDDDEDELLDFADEAREAELANSEQEQHLRRRMMQRDEDEMFGARQKRRGHLESAIDSLARRYQDQTFEEGEGDDMDDQEPAYMDEQTGSFPLPDVTDPKLWIVKLFKNNVEREMVIAMQNKCLEWKKDGQSLGVHSAYAADNLKGAIYVEADNKFAIQEGLKGFREMNLFGRAGIRMVPLREMPQVFTMGNRRKQNPELNDFVRVRRGLYGGDIAQIVDIDEQGTYVTLRLIPRADVTAALERQHMEQPAGSRTKPQTFRKGEKRPPKKFFDKDDVQNRGGTIEQYDSRTGTIRFGSYIFEDNPGYIQKKANLNHLLTGGDVEATVAELKEFKRAKQNDESITAEAQFRDVKKEASSKYLTGEIVEVYKGDLKGLIGRIKSCRDDKSFCIIPEKDEGLKKEVVLERGHLRKKFSVGENVRVVNGLNLGDTGLITSLEGQTAHVFSPSSGQPFSCKVEDITSAPNEGIGPGGLSSLGGFLLGDLVQLANKQTGVIVFINRDATKTIDVLTGEGVVKVPLSEIGTKRSSHLARAYDCNGNQFETRQVVTIREGPLKGRTGRVQHIWKQLVFVKVPDRLESAGYCVVANTQLSVLGGDAARLEHPLYVNTSADHTQTLGAAILQPTEGAVTSAMGSMPPPANRGRGGGGRGGGGVDCFGNRLVVVCSACQMLPVSAGASTCRCVGCCCLSWLLRMASSSLRGEEKPKPAWLHFVVAGTGAWTSAACYC